MSTTKNVSYKINGKNYQFTISENKTTNEFSAKLQGEDKIEGDKIAKAFEIVKKRFPKFFTQERTKNGVLSSVAYCILRRAAIQPTSENLNLADYAYQEGSRISGLIRYSL